MASGRLIELNSSDKLEALINDYTDQCSRNGDKFPSEAGMLLYVRKKTGVMPKDVKANPVLQEALEIGMLIRQQWLEEHMTDPNVKQTAGYVNSLKQPQNGGYVDKNVGKGEKKVKVILTGVGGIEAFE